MNLHSSEYGNLILQPVTQSESAGPYLAGADNFEFRSNRLQISVQEYNKDQVRLIHFVFNVHASTKLDLEHENFALMVRFGLMNTLRIKTKHKSLGRLKPNEAIFYHPVQHKNTFDLLVNNEIRFIDALYADDLISEMKVVFPELSELIANASASIFKKVISINFKIKDILNQILHCPYTENMRRYFFELKVRELLFELMNEHVRVAAPVYFSEQEIRALQQVKDLIVKDLTNHYTISTLAKRVHLNEQKLKLGFKQLFGKGLFETLRENRLEEAKALLRYTDKPVKQVAAECGYARITSFITAFRSQFGLSPTEFRRQMM